MNGMSSISIQCLNLLFSNLCGFSNLIFWMRTPDFKKQLYVSESLSKIYGYSPTEVYENPTTWSAAVDSAERDSVIKRVRLRVSRQVENKEDNEPIFYKVHLPGGKINFIRNVSFPLRDVSGKILSFVGFSESLLRREWELVKAKKIESTSKSIKLVSDISNMLMPDLIKNQEKISPVSRLTQRELDCLMLAKEGKSAKQAAKLLNISYRTIEAHLESVKRKFECKTKLELMSKAHSFLI